MDWFKGKFTGKPHVQWENPMKIHGFRLRFSQQNQSIHRSHRIPVGPMPSALGLFSSKVNSETAGMATRRQLKRALSGA